MTLPANDLAESLADGHRGAPAVDLVDVIVEIPAGTRNKYELDPATGALRLDRQLPASLVYPADYGFVPDTLAEDGDPLDALLLIDEPVVPGCLVRTRPVGVLWVTDEHGRDPKLITVLPDAALTQGWFGLGDLPRPALQAIEHFFSVYKDLDDDRSTRTSGFGGREAALRVLADSRARYAA